jgi:hypothetical protein
MEKKRTNLQTMKGCRREQDASGCKAIFVCVGKACKTKAVSLLKSLRAAACSAVCIQREAFIRRVASLFISLESIELLEISISERHRASRDQHL